MNIGSMDDTKGSTTYSVKQGYYIVEFLGVQSVFVPMPRLVFKW